MTLEFYEDNRLEAAKIAKAMLEENANYLVGARKLSTLRHQVGLTEDDPDFAVFSLIDSETDHLPIGHEREYWSAQALIRLRPEIERSTQWAKKMSLEHCNSIVRRFGI